MEPSMIPAQPGTVLVSALGEVTTVHAWLHLGLNSALPMVWDEPMGLLVVHPGAEGLRAEIRN